MNTRIGNERSYCFLFRDRMHIVIERKQSQYWFEYWAKQFETMWDASRVDTADEERAG